MEIKNNPVVCPKCGNYYNPSKHATCPVCSSGSEVGATIPVGGGGLGATTFDETEQPYADGGNFIKTEPPYSDGGSGSFGPTEPPHGGDRFIKTETPYSDNGGGSSPFQPTMIGGDLGVSGGAEPVVGWLVCIDGPVRGNDYRLHAGYNYIGRESGDVRISGDQQVSRQNHAMIAFDETDLIYYVGPSAGRNIIKVNGKAVINAVELHSYDIISIGTTKLIFVALCGEQFSWKKG
ncbi:MAG: FHA domain-containing protein [Clostridiales bacterium]|nr:FHA domain-containing protein [Clostridiales bacterium]